LLSLQPQPQPYASASASAGLGVGRKGYMPILFHKKKKIHPHVPSIAAATDMTSTTNNKTNTTPGLFGRLHTKLGNILSPERRYKIEAIVRGDGSVQPFGRNTQHFFYWFTAMDTILSVFRNQYCSPLKFVDAFLSELSQNNKQGVVQKAYEKLFYFARLRPRLLYSVGALVRALSLCTPLHHIIDPTVGVGAGIHLFAFLSGARWVKPVVLGWATTKYFWTTLGAKSVEKAYIPITLSIHEWETDKTKPKTTTTHTTKNEI